MLLFSLRSASSLPIHPWFQIVMALLLWLRSSTEVAHSPCLVMWSCIILQCVVLVMLVRCEDNPQGLLALLSAASVVPRLIFGDWCIGGVGQDMLRSVLGLYSIPPLVVVLCSRVSLQGSLSVHRATIRFVHSWLVPLWCLDATHGPAVSLVYLYVWFHSTVSTSSGQSVVAYTHLGPNSCLCHKAALGKQREIIIKVGPSHEGRVK